MQGLLHQLLAFFSVLTLVIKPHNAAGDDHDDSQSEEEQTKAVDKHVASRLTRAPHAAPDEHAESAEEKEGKGTRVVRHLTMQRRRAHSKRQKAAEVRQKGVIAIDGLSGRRVASWLRVLF